MTTDCPCDDPPKRLLRIPAGLSALPRQTQAFPEVRIALLAEVARTPELDGWQARGERDFGVMWLEMWAYVADVLGFYDERISNESYIRTAVRRPSLRRIVDLLGYVPAPGVAGSAVIAAIAEGRTPVPIAASTAFRSDAFGDEPPQVFETQGPISAHAFTNSWEIGAVAVPTVGPASTSTSSTSTSTSSGSVRSDLVFETQNFGLAKDRTVLFQLHPSDTPEQWLVRKVTGVGVFEGKDGRTYATVQLDSAVDIAVDADLANIKVLTPTVTARITSNLPPRDPPDNLNKNVRLARIANPPEGGTRVFLDSIYRQLRIGEPVIATRQAANIRAATAVSATSEALVSIEAKDNINDEIRIPVTQATLLPALDSALFVDPVNVPFNEISFHFAFVDAGRMTRVADTEPTGTDLRSSDGVPLVGLPEVPPSASGGVLTQKFLLRDADNQGALVTGTITFNPNGTARFKVTGDEELPSTLKTPITVFGNILETTRGESVFDEVLGNGDPRQLHQAFKLKKKPLTYIFDPSVEGTHARSTLQVRVDGILWHEARSFFGKGPEDRVYIVRPDDKGDTFLIFGDGARGARPPSGVKNIRASYRFGSGEAAPPAGAIKQLSKAVKGLRRAESPIAAVAGKDPDPPETLRTAAPRSALLFGRAVSTLDFEALANLLPGVVRATAEFLWIPEQQEAGVVVTYIGTAEEEFVLGAMRDQAEPNLPLAAKRAEAWFSFFGVEVEVHPDFDPAVVALAVHAALTHPETGPLSKRNAPIGQRLARSVVFDVVHHVAGVVSIKSAFFFTFTPAGAFIYVDFKNSRKTGVCAGAGAYLDFSDGNGVGVSGTTATAPALGVEVNP
jgi:hypothetical protein